MRVSRDRIWTCAGWALVSVGALLNEFLLGLAFSPNGRIESATPRILIALFELWAIALGALILMRRKLHLGKSLAAKLMLLLASIVFALCAAEVTLRFFGHRPYRPSPVDITVEPEGQYHVAHPTLGYALRPGRYTLTLKSEYPFTATHGADGLRITRATSGASNFRKGAIWVMGCSYTYGWSLNDDETYPWLLQVAMPEYDVVNFGVGGYGTLQSLIQLREALGTREAPACVVLAYSSMHDLRNTLSRRRRKAMAPYNKIGMVRQPFARLGGDGALQIDMGEFVYRPAPLMRRLGMVHLAERAYNGRELRSWHPREITGAIIGEFMALAEKRGFDFVLAGITDDALTREMLGSFEERGVPCVDISVDLNVGEYRNEPRDGHPSAAANRVYAKRLGLFLRSRMGEGG